MKPSFHLTFSLLRYATVAIVAIAAAFVAIDQRGPGAVRGSGMYDDSVYTFGWPFAAGAHQISQPILANPPQGMERIDHWDINWWLVVLNLALLAVIVLCVFGIARFYLPLIRFRRLSLSALFVAVTTASLITVLLTMEFDPMVRLFASIATPVGAYYPITLNPFWISIPVLYGLSCVSIVLANFLGRSTRRLTWFLRKVPSGSPS